MLTILRLLFSSLRSSLRSRAALQAEILALCHQLMVLQRSTQGRRVRFLTIDRVFWVWLSLSLAERVCRKADRFNSPRMSGSCINLQRARITPHPEIVF